MKKFAYALLFLLFAGCFSPRGVKEKLEEELSAKESKTQTICLTFAGDIMAHDSNFKMSDYSKIYADLSDILLSDDLSFGNMEMPICDSLPMSNYPRFNVHSPYLEAAINGGFDVFSLANNHTNDKGIVGIDGTLKSTATLQEKYRDRGIFFSGIKKRENDKMQACVIERNGFTILYLAITELLNSYDASKMRVYYSAPNKEARQALLKTISTMRKEKPSDLFILSLHLNEAEYGRKVSESKKQWFRQLAKAGVDIICASHPHVMQTWEKCSTASALENDLGEGKFSLHSSFFMYSMGNFISAQRMRPNYANPRHYREYTGDAVLLQVTFSKVNGKVLNDFTIKPILLTVYKSKDGLVMKRLNKDFIESLDCEQDKKYYKTRRKLMQDYLPIR